MLNAQITTAALSLPEEDRRHLAQQLIDSLDDDSELLSDEEIAKEAQAGEYPQLLMREDVQEVIGRIKDLASGRVRGLTEEEYLAALQ